MWVNTKEFSPVALGKEVCNAHPQSLEMKGWVKTQLDRIKNGYTVGGQYITGDMYFFLNFYKVFNKNTKAYSYPIFLDFQAEFCQFLQDARDGLQGVVCVKRRQAGISELCASIIVRELWFNQAPQILMLADGDAQLKPLKKNTSNFINELNKGIFAKNFAVNTPNYKRLGYQASGSNVWQGQSGEIYARNFTKGNTEVVVGLTPTLVVFDEAGKADGLIDTLEAVRPAITNMEDDMVGTPIIFGAVGDMERSNDLKEIFYSPSVYNMKSTLVEGEKASTGYFIEGWRMLVLDADGNSNKEKGIVMIEEKREKAKSKNDERALLATISYFPLTPAEAFLDRGANTFNTLKIKNQQDLISESGVLNKLKYGEIEFLNDEWKFYETIDYLTYASKSKDSNKHNTNGRFLVYEEPERVDGKIPDGKYIIGADPFHLDEGTSLGAIYVFKRMVEGGETLADLPVCEYLYRPSNPTLFAEDILKLCNYYNAVAMVEPSTSSVKDYFWQENMLKFLARTPRIVTNLSSGSQVKYGFPINAGTKSYGIGLVGKYIDDHIENIFFPRLLKEMLDYNSNGNFDLIMAYLQVMAYRSDLWDYKNKKEEQQKKKFPRFKWVNGKLTNY